MRLQVHTLIDAPSGVVWRLITDIEHAARHLSGIEKVEVIDRPRTGLVGLKWRETRTLFGKTATEVMWITEATADQHYDVRAESHGAIYTTRIHLDEVAGGTALTMTFEARPVTFGARLAWTFFGWLFRGATRKGLQKDLDDIKRAVEAGPAG